MTKSNRFIKKFTEDLHAEIFSYIGSTPSVKPDNSYYDIYQSMDKVKAEDFI